MESFKMSLRIFPKAMVVQLLLLGITLGVTFGMIFLGLIILLGLASASYSSPSSFLVILIIVLILLLGAVGLSFVITILFTYVIQSLVFDGTGVTNSFKRSWRFARQYFWTTVGVTILFNVASNALGFFLVPSYAIFGISSFVIIISSMVSRLVEAYRTICFGWAFEEFKHTIT
jgi:hypothetical protein